MKLAIVPVEAVAWGEFNGNRCVSASPEKGKFCVEPLYRASPNDGKVTPEMVEDALKAYLEVAVTLWDIDDWSSENIESINKSGMVAAFRAIGLEVE